MHDKKKNGGCAVWSVLLHHRNHLVPSPIRPCDIQSHDLSSDLHIYYLSVGFFPTHFFSLKKKILVRYLLIVPHVQPDL